MPKYTKQEDGYFHARVWDGSYKGGKKHYIHITSNKSSRDLELKVEKIKFERENHGKVVAKTNVTLGEYAKKWLDLYKGDTEAQTYNMYDNIIRNHLGELSDKPIDIIRNEDLKLLINSKKDKQRICQELVMTLKQMFKCAEHDKILRIGTTVDLFFDIKTPQYQSKEKTPITKDEKDKIFKAENLTDKEKAFLYLLYYTGMRRQEALALTVDDIGEQISINKAIGMDKRKYTSYIKIPKTQRGYRKLPIADTLRSVLEPYVATLREQGKEYLFTMRGGGIMTDSSYQKMWAQIRRKTECPEITAHRFRHNYCTELCYAMYEGKKITIKKIAYLLGDTEKMVMEVYSHILDEKERPEDVINSVF